MSKGKPDPLEVQISVTLRLPRDVAPTAITAALVDELIAYRIEHGHDHPRAKTRIITWRNPNRRGAGARWRTGNQDDAWETLGRALVTGGARIARVDE